MAARCFVACALWAVAFATIAFAQAKPLLHDESDAFFANVEIPELRIWIEPRQMDRLAVAPREYVCGVLTENGVAAYGPVGVKLKGAAGSYRNWEDRPALTVSMRKFNKKGEFHGLRKFHLNNSVQDPTYFNEFVSSELFLKAGVPAPRVSYARVWLNDRDVGFYVLKEGFDELFLKRYFPDAKGNLYEGPFCADIDRELEKECGDGPDDRSDLKAVIAAANTPDPAARRQAVSSVVDVDLFSTFMAMERVTCHWDGYCGNRNNYRVYFHQGKVVFLPSGMDQMFGSPGQSLFDGSGSTVARAIMDDPELKARYQQRAMEAAGVMTPIEPLLARVDFAESKIRPVLEKMDRGWAERHAGDVEGLKRRLVERANFLRQHVAAERANMPQEFDASGTTVLRDWRPQTASGSPVLDEPTVDGRRTLHVSANGQPCSASWRRKILLGPGVYTLSADVRLKDVVPADDQSGLGVGMSGTPRPQKLGGSVSQTVTFEFTVSGDRQQPELVLELKAKSGEAWFDADSLKLTRKR